MVKMFEDKNTNDIHYRTRDRNQNQQHDATSSPPCPPSHSPQSCLEPDLINHLIRFLIKLSERNTPNSMSENQQAGINAGNEQPMAFEPSSTATESAGSTNGTSSSAPTASSTATTTSPLNLSSATSSRNRDPNTVPVTLPGSPFGHSQPELSDSVVTMDEFIFDQDQEDVHDQHLNWLAPTTQESLMQQ